MDWLRVSVNLKNHPKSLRLGVILHKERAHSYVTDLWAWAAQFYPDGDISESDALDVALACGWDGDPETFLQALEDCGWLDVQDGCRLIHGWEEYQGKLIERAERARERSREWRSRKVNERTAKAKRTRTERTRTLLRTYVRTNETNERTEETTPGFDAWYTVYYRKEKKAEAQHAWEKLTDDQRTRALAVVASWCRWKMREPDWQRYRPLPASWLNGHRFDDEIPPEPGPRCTDCGKPPMKGSQWCVECLRRMGVPEADLQEAV